MSDRRSSICLFGAGGYGRVVAAQMRAAGFQSFWFADDTAQPGTVIDGVPVYSSQNSVTEDFASLVTIGDHQVRKKIHSSLLSQSKILIRFMRPCAVAHSEHPIDLGGKVLSGAMINPGFSIVPWTTVGAGAVVTNSIATAGTYVGVPARLHQER